MYNLAQTSEKLLFMRILNDAVNSMGIEYKYKGNGRPSIGIEDMVKCCVIKVFNCFSCRRTSPDLHMAMGLGYIEHVPHFNSISNYMKMPEISGYLDKLYRALATPFAGIESCFAIDATGFGKYNTIWTKLDKKTQYSRCYNKLHIITGVRTNIITVAKITEGRDHDVMHFPELLRKTCRNFTVKEIYADKGYLSLYNVNAAKYNGAVPYIMPKGNTKLATKKRWKNTEAWDIMVTMWRHNQEEFRRHYHLRSNVESTFSAMKRKFLPYIRSKHPIAQRNEILCKVVCHNASVLINGIFELGTKAEFGKADIKRGSDQNQVWRCSNEIERI